MTPLTVTFLNLAGIAAIIFRDAVGSFEFYSSLKAEFI